MFRYASFFGPKGYGHVELAAVAGTASWRVAVARAAGEPDDGVVLLYVSPPYGRSVRDSAVDAAHTHTHRQNVTITTDGQLANVELALDPDDYDGTIGFDRKLAAIRDSHPNAVVIATSPPHPAPPEEPAGLPAVDRVETTASAPPEEPEVPPAVDRVPARVRALSARVA